MKTERAFRISRQNPETETSETLYGSYAAKAVQHDVRDAIEAVAKKLGLALTGSSATYGDTDIRITLRLDMLDDEGNAMGAKADLAVLGRGDWFNQEFEFGGVIYKIVGANLNARAYPIQAVMVPGDGRKYKFPMAVVAKAMGE